MKVIAHNGPDGLRILVPNQRNRGAGESDADFLARVWSREVETSAQKNRYGESVRPWLTASSAFLIVESEDLPPRDQYAKRAVAGGKIVNR